ncbi:hypothetical protein BJ912DRAFT_503710 [Pholiota molesta]|nr:hypothetical protein BJ912DRAFT_503710 [Pholiota molesta]
MRDMGAMAEDELGCADGNRMDVSAVRMYIEVARQRLSLDATMTTRRHSLVLPPQPKQAPIPPSLVQSPYLNAPLFTNDLNPPRLPTDAAERWLQDTVPISADSAMAQDRRGSIMHKQPSSSPHTPSVRHPSYPASGPITPVADAAAPPHTPPMSGFTKGHARYLAHSLAPPPDVVDQFNLSPRSPTTYTASRPAYMAQARSTPNIHRAGTENGSQTQSQRNSYFPPHIPPMR